jgi:glycosyltransferase involved in cell wall biosynthesis
MNPAGGESSPSIREASAVLIPAFLEERRIREVVERSRRESPRVVVVDDGSHDATAREAAAGGAEVISHPQNRGKGAAIKTGLAHLRGDTGVQWIVLLDGDGQHRPEEIPRFFEAAGSGAKLFVGNRMEDTATMPFVRRTTNRVMSGLIGRLCGQRVPDSQCGFRMVHRDLIDALSTGANGYDYETEMLFIVSRMGCVIGAVPVSTIYGDETSKIRAVRDTIRFVALLARYRK